MVGEWLEIRGDGGGRDQGGDGGRSHGGEDGGRIQGGTDGRRDPRTTQEMAMRKVTNGGSDGLLWRKISHASQDITGWNDE